MSTRFTHPAFGMDSETAVAPAFHHAVRSQFAIRYSGAFTPKILTQSEYARNKANDIGTVVCFENGANNALQGYDQGKADAEFAMKQTSAMGRPAKRPIFFAVDFPSFGSDVDSYFAGIEAVLGMSYSGPYGDYAVCAHLLDKGFDWAFQTYAWSAGKVDKRAQILQYSNDHIVGGVGVDFDYGWYEDYGQWDYKHVIADPNHYSRFIRSYEYKGREMHERALTIKYDEQRLHPNLHKGSLEVLRADLRDCADHIYDVASAHRKKGSTLPMEWGPWWRHWRYPQLIHRANGEKVAV